MGLDGVLIGVEGFENKLAKYGAMALFEKAEQREAAQKKVNKLRGKIEGFHSVVARTGELSPQSRQKIAILRMNFMSFSERFTNNTKNDTDVEESFLALKRSVAEAILTLRENRKEIDIYRDTIRGAEGDDAVWRYKQLNQLSAFIRQNGGIEAAHQAGQDRGMQVSMLLLSLPKEASDSLQRPVERNLREKPMDARQFTAVSLANSASYEQLRKAAVEIYVTQNVMQSLYAIPGGLTAEEKEELKQALEASSQKS